MRSKVAIGVLGATTGPRAWDKDETPRVDSWNSWRRLKLSLFAESGRWIAALSGDLEFFLQFGWNLGFSFLGCCTVAGATRDDDKKQEKEKESFCHMPVSPARAISIGLEDFRKFEN